MEEDLIVARGKMINCLRDFKFERNEMDKIIADQRRTMFNGQKEMSE